VPLVVAVKDRNDDDDDDDMHHAKAYRQAICKEVRRERTGTSRSSI
jgi:hypothetical protein